MVERMTLNHVVAGSIPAVGAQRENAKLLSEGRTQAFPWRAPIPSFGSGLAGSNWISLRSQWWWLVLTTHSAIALRLPVAWSRVRSRIHKKRENLFLPLLLVVAPPTRCGFESRPASNPCVAGGYHTPQVVVALRVRGGAGSIPSVAGSTTRLCPHTLSAELHSW